MAVAGVAVAGMVLAGCSGGDGDGGGDDKKTGTTPSEQTPQEDPTPPDPTQAPREATGDATGDAKKVQGNWTDKAAMTGNAEMLGLIITKNQVITMGSSKNSSCVGALAGDAFPLSFALKCQGSGGGWDKGKVTGVQGKRLAVAWDSGKNQTLIKSGKPSALPSGLPTQ